MANDNLEFGLRLGIDMDALKKEWEDKEKDIQKMIDDSAFKIKLDGVEGLDKIRDQLKEIQKLQKDFSKPLTGAQALREQLKHEERARLANAKAMEFEAGSADRLRRQKAQAELTELRLARAKEKSVKVTNAQTQAYRRQSGVLNGLKQFMNSYISLLGGYRLLSNIKQITSEFELQRVSLRAITQDASFADALFAKIKATATESPFATKELTTYTKQLAAYRIENEQLYDTMNMLADVSAGLGVSMDRLILAYGQVKAASVLRGTELRQFTEAGIPLVDELAKKFSQLRGEVVSTGEVFDLISQREVPFEMVADIFREMTAEGGRFYEMQKKQSESLYGVFENLKDNIQNAYDEIGQSQRGLLMGAGKVLTYMSKHLNEVALVLEPLIAGFGAWNIGLKLIGSSSAKLAATNAILLKTERDLNRASVSRVAFLRQYSVLMAKATATNNKYAIASLRAAAANKGFIRSLHLLWAAMLKNPVTAIVTGIVALGAAIYAIISYESPFTKMMNNVSKATSELSSNAESSGVALDKLLGRLQQAKQGSQEYADIVAEINRRYADFLPEQLKVSQSYDEIAKSVRGVKTALMEKARAEAYSAGITQIESHFADTMKEEYEDIFKSLTSQGLFEGKPLFSFNQKEAQDIISKTLAKIKENPDIAKEGRKAGSLLIESIEEVLSGKGINMEVGFEDTIVSLGDSFKEIAKMYSSLDKALEQHFGMIDTIFSQPFSKEVDVINQKYADLRRSIESKSYADDKEGQSVLRKQELLETEGARLNELIKVYTKYEQFDLAKKTREELNKLLEVGDGWRVAVDKIIDNNQRLLKFKYKEDDSIFDYADTLISKYKKIKEQITLNLKVSDSEKKRMESEAEGLRQLAKAIGLDIDAAIKPKGSQDTSRLDALKSELSLVEKIYKRYEDLRKLKTDTSAKADIEDIYGGLTDIDFLTPETLKNRLREMLAKAQALGEQGKQLAIEIALKIQDIDLNEIRRKLESSLSKLSQQIKQQQDASDFFEKMLGLTGDVELSTKLTLGVTGVELQEGGARSLLAQQLAEILTMSPIAAAVPTDFVIDGEWNAENIQKAIQEGKLTVSQIRDVIANLTSMGKDDLAKSLEGALASFVDYNKQLVNEVYSTLAEYGDFADKIELIKAQTDITTKVRPPEIDDAAWDAYTAALQRKQDEVVAAINFDKFKKEFALQLSNMDIVSNAMLQKMRDELTNWLGSQAGLNASEADRKAVLELIEKIDNIKLERNPFEEWIKALENFKRVKDEGSPDEIEAAWYDLQRASKVSGKAIAGMANAISGVVDGALNIAETLGIAFSDDTMAVIESFKKGLGAIAPIMMMVGNAMLFAAASGMTLQAALLPLLAITVGLGAIFGAINFFSNKKVRAANKEIERQEKLLKGLERAYERLEETQGQLVGTDWVRNQQQQIANLQRQVSAFEAQRAAEQSKGKKRDEDAIEDYTDKILDAQKQIRELQRGVTEEMVGTGLPDAAKDFAQSWLDAYLSFDDTMGALKSSFKDMMKTMVQNSMMAKLVQKRLEPVFTAIDKAYEDAQLTPAEWQSIMDMGNTAIKYIDEDLTHLAEMLGLREQLGSQDTSELTGIAKGVAQASEETVLTLAGYANSILYYQIGLKNDVAAIRAVLEGKVAAVTPAATGDGFNVGQLVTLQQQSLTQLQAINANTGNTVTQLQELNNKIDSVISAQGTSARKVLNTRLSN